MADCGRVACWVSDWRGVSLNEHVYGWRAAEFVRLCEPIAAVFGRGVMWVADWILTRARASRRLLSWAKDGKIWGTGAPRRLCEALHEERDEGLGTREAAWGCGHRGTLGTVMGPY
ncbi:hypothetical protein FRC12_004534 [Ceratobasidium sp. 428]|nr:hypothetical protein FRC12_004534 [Ceratobasidium sp. 428]